MRSDQESCEDYISRQTTLNALWKALYDYEDKTEKQFSESKELDLEDWFQHRIFVQNMSDIDRQVILDMPSVQSLRSKGQWIRKENNECWWYECNQCGVEPLKNKWNNSDVLSDFCPNCGAKMKRSRIC